MKDYPNLSPLPVNAWDSSLSYIIDDMQGKPLNVHSLMANHPGLLNAWWNFRCHAVTGGELGRRNCELIILRVSVHMKSWYEWASHVERALGFGLTLDEIERVKLGSQAPEWSDGESLLLKAADELFADHAIDPQTLCALQQHYNVRQLMDLIAIHGMYVILGGMLNTWGLELDEHIQQLLPDDVTREKFESDTRINRK
ncbi:MAG: carboxymuconolactone decarboxylase family protein [Desulfuromonadales bacterium]